jgi:DKNYY family
MGNKPSTPEGLKFGSIYGIDGKVRPGYYLAKNKVMYKGEIIPLLENETDFQKLKYGYLKSNKRVFYNGKQISMANPATFSVITRNNGVISKNPLKNKELSKLNTVLGMDFVGNQKRIYFRNDLIHTE